MAQDIHVPKASHLGWLINQAFHDFELTVTVISPIAAQLTSDECNDTITFTKPHEIIAITSILPVSRESVCRSELTVSRQPATKSPIRVTSGVHRPPGGQGQKGARRAQSWTRGGGGGSLGDVVPPRLGVSRFFVMLVFLFCKLFEHYSQTNFPIIKTMPFKVTQIKKGWQIFRPK